jgi:hypothetical protein
LGGKEREIKRQKAKGKRQKLEGKGRALSLFLPFAFCLLPFDFLQSNGH